MEKTMREVVIAGYLRTAQSRSRPNDPARDWFHKLRADELLAKLLPEVIKRTGIRAEEIDDFIMGSAYGVTEQWSYGGRFPIFLANLPVKIPAKFVDQQCGSGMACIHFGFLEIASGFADIVMVGGMEHMTRVPMGAMAEKGHISLNKRFFTEPIYKHWDMMTSTNMGLTAEKLFTLRGFSKEDMDRWGTHSHQLASKAYKEGFFKEEIFPIEAEQADGKSLVVDRDQAVRDDATLEGMKDLKPAFKPDGVITAGNSSPLNAAAASLILMSKETAKKKGIRPPVHGIRRSGPHHHGRGSCPRKPYGLREGGFAGERHRLLGDQRGLRPRCPELHQGVGYRSGSSECDGRRYGHRPCLGSHGSPSRGNPGPDLESQGWTLRSCQRLRRWWTGGGHHH